MSGLFELREFNEQRPLDWRWLRAVLLEDKKARISDKEDTTVTEIRKFLRDQRAGVASETLCYKYPVLFEVHRIHNDTQHTTRWTLEALIMANESVDSICKRFGWSDIGKQIVETYEKCKFDVRSRLQFNSFILTEVLGTEVYGSITPSEEKIWKLFAWLGYRKNIGTALFDGYVNIEHMDSSVKEWFDTFIEQQFTRKAVRALIKSDPIHNPNVIDIVKTYHDRKKMEMDFQLKKLTSGATPEDEKNKQLLESVTMTIASFHKTASSAIEPRAKELIDLDLAKLAEQFKPKSLPENTNE